MPGGAPLCHSCYGSGTRKIVRVYTDLTTKLLNLRRLHARPYTVPIVEKIVERAKAVREPTPGYRPYCTAKTAVAVSTAGDTELVFVELRIIKIEDNSIAARISTGADIAVITRENNNLMLVTNKFDPMAIPDKSDPMLIFDKIDPVLVKGKHVFGAENVSGSDNILKVAIPTTLKIVFQEIL